MSLPRLTESIRRAGAGLEETKKFLFSELAEDFGAPPASTIRRIVRDWAEDGVELAGHRVRVEKHEGRLYMCIEPAGRERARPPVPVMRTPLYHQFGRVVSL